MSYIRLRDITVRIPIYDQYNAKVGSRDKSHSGSTLIMHALESLTLELSQGDRVCLIGHNGAGKTTLLRVLAGIYPPTSGVIEVSGRVFALLGSSMALNNDATGYENIRLIANLYQWPIDRLSDYIRDIEEFTELGEYLSLPTRVYSAGMQARLAFAMATTQSADILLIDEGIAAGDAQFQEKAGERLKQFMNRAKIIVLASHSEELCRTICSKALLLAKGREVFFGGIDEAFVKYAESH
jgi:ABC-type polysaccharide/polyol phosphate transport system ATPase subunit